MQNHRFNFGNFNMSARQDMCADQQAHSRVFGCARQHETDIIENKNYSHVHNDQVTK